MPTLNDEIQKKLEEKNGQGFNEVFDKILQFSQSSDDTALLWVLKRLDELSNYASDAVRRIRIQKAEETV